MSLTRMSVSKEAELFARYDPEGMHAGDDHSSMGMVLCWRCNHLRYILPNLNRELPRLIHELRSSVEYQRTGIPIVDIDLSVHL